VRLLYLGGLAAFGSEIGRKRLLLLIFDPHQRRSEFGDFPVLRYDQPIGWPLNLMLSS
jgi:hypothetical protein